jgi:hypothetical protein
MKAHEINDNGQLATTLAFAQQVVQQLSAMYQQLGLEEGGKDFATEVYFPMLESEPDPNDLEDQLENAQGDVSNLDMMKLSCAYLVGAIRAETEGDHENAWVAISHAQYWMGMAYGLGFMKLGGTLALKTRSGNGGKKANENQYGKLQKIARELAMQHLEWSRLAVAYMIVDAVVEASKTMEDVQPITAEEPVWTIYDWIEGIPFGKKRRPRSANTKR